MRVRCRFADVTRGVVVAGLLAVAGCTGPTSIDVPPVAVVVLPSASASVPAAGKLVNGFPLITSGSQLSLAVWSLGHSSDDERLFHDASYVLMRRCVERFGERFTYPNVPPPPEVSDRQETRYGMTDLSVARSRGYGMYVSRKAFENSMYSKKWLSEHFRPTDREYQILYGRTPDDKPVDPTIVDRDGKPIPEHGCNGNAEEHRLVDPETMSKLTVTIPGHEGGADRLPMILGDSWDRTEADPRTAAVTKQWSNCMAGKGYTFAQRWGVDNFDHTKPPTRAEIKTATADVECAYQVNYLGVWNGVEREYEQKQIASHETEIREYSAAFQAMRDRARQIIAEG